jgi:hypothetical protein
MGGEGVLHHQEFLACGVHDPRRQFAETLIEALASSDESIIVYSAYERTVRRSGPITFSNRFSNG